MATPRADHTPRTSRPNAAGLGRALAPVALVAAAALAAGCGAGASTGRAPGSGTDRVNYHRMAQVAADTTATATEVVEAGAPVEAARSGTTRLVAYNVHNDDDEGHSAGAWRLYDGDGDGDGDTIADGSAGTTEEGHAHPDVISLSDGYLLVHEDGTAQRVSTSGTITPVRARRRPERPRAGDIQLGSFETRMYRPADNTILRPLPKPPYGRQSWALTEDGTLWSQGDPQGAGEATRATFAYSPAGRPWSHVAPYTPGRGRTVVSEALIAVGTRIVAPVVTLTADSEHAELVGVIFRDSSAPASQPWTWHKTPNVPGHLWAEVAMSPFDDHTVMLAAPDAAPQLLNLDTGATTRIPEPTAEEGWHVRAEAGELLATHPNHTAARTSSDLGSTWQLLPH